MSVVGDFHAWHGQRHPERRLQAGVWEICDESEHGVFAYLRFGVAGVAPIVSIRLRVPPLAAAYFRLEV